MKTYKKKAALFIASQGVTLFGSSVVQFAIVWYVALQTSSGVWVSLLTMAAYVPQFLISFFSGVWADRYPKKRLIILADAGIAVCTLLLVMLLPYIGEGTPTLTALLVISILRSLGTGVQTPAVNAAIPMLVPEDSLMKFNGVNATVQSIVQFAAPAAAGAVLSVATMRAALLIDIATAVIGIGILAAVAIPIKETEASSAMFSDMKAGIRYATGNHFIGKLLIIFGIFIFLCVPAGFLSSLFVSRYYGETYWYLTLVEVIGFIGMMAGGLLIGAWGGFKNRVKTFVVGMIAFGLLAICMGAVSSFVVYLIMMAIYGVALTMVQTAATTLLQENTDPVMQGRIFGLFGAVFSGFLPLGMAVFGPLSDFVSMRFLMILSGVFLILLAAIVLCDRNFYRHKQPSEINEGENPENE